VELDGFSMKLYKHIAHIQALKATVFDIIEAYEHWEDSVPEVAQLLRQEAPDAANAITDERVTAIVNKLVHELDTEPLDTPDQRPLGEMLGLNTKEDYRRAINKGLGYFGYTLRDGNDENQVQAPQTVVVDAENEQHNDIAVSSNVRTSTPANGASSVHAPRRKRQMTGAQSAPRDGYASAQPKIKKYLDKYHPEMSNISDINMTQLAAALGRDRRTAKVYITKFLAEHQPVQQ
jgi:hypothetical protein